MLEQDDQKNYQTGEEPPAKAGEPVSDSPVYEYGQTAGTESTSPTSTTGENIPPYHPEEPQPSYPTGNGFSTGGNNIPPTSQGNIPPIQENGMPTDSQGSGAPDGRTPVEYAPPMNGMPFGGAPTGRGTPPAGGQPPQQNQWTFNDYGPLGGSGKPKKPKKPKASKVRSGGVGSDGNRPSFDGTNEVRKPGSGTGVKVLAIVMSVLFVFSVAGFGGYILYDMNTSEKLENGETTSSAPSFHIQDSPEINNGQNDSSTLPAITGNKMDPSDIYAAVEPAVVGVVGYVKNRSGVYQLASQGSGVVFDSNGYIVTNRHVIKDETTDQNFEKIEVIRTTGETYTAVVLGSDKETDLAVLKVEDTGLKSAVFGDSSRLKVGDRAFVIGNPSGMEYAGSLAGGYVSAVNREVLLESTGGRVELIQTDAAINPGNSGGALVNEYGQVVGITSAKLVGEEYEGMGFAIPINNVKPIVESLIDNGYVTGRVQIGITYKVISKTLADLNGLPQGLRVVSISEGSDAAVKGLREGDIIYAMDGKEVPDTPSVKEVLNGKKSGDVLRLSVYRVDMLSGKAERLEIPVTLMEKITKES